MHLTLANLSTTIAPTDFQAAVHAVARQVREHFLPEWGGDAAVSGVTTTLAAGALAPVQGRRSAIVYVGDACDDPSTGVQGVLGYHAVNHRELPFGFVYLDVCREAGEPWSVALSHETLELLADPSAALTAKGEAPPPATGAVAFAVEVADPTQGDRYAVDGVEVSNFVGRAWFGLLGGSGRTNFLGLPLAPFALRPGGYCQYTTAGGGVQQVCGPQAQRALQARARLGDARRTARRRGAAGPSPA